ncbi:MAG: M23 family metallopeptidase [Clostridia bacterium]|nr:M23 family metallopeptidase [Clostridia bacterium]
MLRKKISARLVVITAVAAVSLCIGYSAALVWPWRATAPTGPQVTAAGIKTDTGDTWISAGLDAATPVSAPAPRRPETMTMPVQGKVVADYGWQRDPILSDWRFRDGIDILCDAGAQASAALSGTVREAAGNGSSGFTVVLEHRGGVSTVYANLRTLLVSTGDSVEQGSGIGDVGASPEAGGSVLRFKVECEGELRDPASCMGLVF